MVGSQGRWIKTQGQTTGHDKGKIKSGGQCAASTSRMLKLKRVGGEEKPLANQSTAFSGICACDGWQWQGKNSGSQRTGNFFE